MTGGRGRPEDFAILSRTWGVLDGCGEALSAAGIPSVHGVDEETLHRWVRAIERKGQAILYGPPGTGKTHLARHLARHPSRGGSAPPP